MSRLIDADALKEHKFVDTDDNYRIGWNNALDAVANFEPTVDAVPIKHGKWIEYPTADGMNQCSACGVLRFVESNYCPNCGAYMLTRPNEFCSNAERKDEK